MPPPVLMEPMRRRKTRRPRADLNLESETASLALFSERRMRRTSRKR
jgi:hypothetical protein